MKLPDLLENAIENEVSKYDIKVLKEKALNLSNRYMTEERKGKTFINDFLVAVAYSVIRMPATYSAIRESLEKTLEIYNPGIKSVLDIGSGTGAAEWVIDDILDVDDITCLEREKDMRDISKIYFSYNENLKSVKFIDADILKEDLNLKKDLCILSYMINELDEHKRLEIVKKALNATNKIMLIVEPGTPEGFNNIKKIRDFAYEEGYSIIAPCTGFCGRCDIKEDDWCASSIRVQRTKIHKYLKDADVPFEDEKFSYIAISKEKIDLNDNEYLRILRHPKIENGRVTVKFCQNGEIIEKVITKKDKELFKKVKKKNIGDIV